MTDGADIIIATPGRFLSHLTLGYVDLSELQCLILDEADRMLDMGFVGDIMRIAEKCRDDRQTLLFSATMPDRIEDLASDLQKDPEVVKLALSKPAEKIKQGAYVLFDHQKDDVLVEVLKDRNVASGIVFTSRKKTVGQVIRVLRKAGIKCERISSDSEQSEREEVMLGFRQRKFPILVATDVVSRGIDIDNIELVVNYDVPPNEEDYVHRIGRTARANRDGEGITLVNPDDQQRFGRIERLIERSVDKLDLPGKVGKGPEYDPKADDAEAVEVTEVARAAQPPPPRQRQQPPKAQAQGRQPPPRQRSKAIRSWRMTSEHSSRRRSRNGWMRWALRRTG